MISLDFISLACCFQCDNDYGLVGTERTHVYAFSSICNTKLHTTKFLMIAEQVCENSSNNYVLMYSFLWSTGRVANSINNIIH